MGMEGNGGKFVGGKVFEIKRLTCLVSGWIYFIKIENEHLNLDI